MPNMIGLWSNDPGFYEMILGGEELTGQVFIKVNGDPKTVIEKFGMRSTDGVLYRSNIGDKKYMCMVGKFDHAQELSNKMKEIISTEYQ